MNVPLIIQNATNDWPATINWTFAQLCHKYRHEKFKVGENDKGKSVFMPLKHFGKYSKKQKDDSPLYVFDSSFASRTTNNTYVNKPSVVTKDSSHPPSDLLNDFSVPSYFKDDLFKYTGGRRPPYRWLVMGPARSGSGMHQDPLGTSAWNALVSGHKRWVLFPPDAPRSVLYERIGDHEAITWFDKVYPKLVKPLKNGSSLASQYGMIELVQRPGEIIFVPSGYYHIVINLDDTVAITQNFASRVNFDYVWLKTRFSRPRLAAKLEKQIKARAENLDRPDAKVFQRLMKVIRRSQSVPALFTSSDHSSSSSEDSSSSSDYESEPLSTKKRKISR